MTLPDNEGSVQAGNANRKWRWIIFAIVALSAFIYLPSLRGGPVWDDHDLISGKGTPGATTRSGCFTHPFLSHYYRPLTSASILIDRTLWGDKTVGFHATNLILHVLATAGLIALLGSAFKDRRIAAAGGLLFAIQPAQIGATAWIGGRTDALCVFWVILFAWLLIKAAHSEIRRPVWLTAALLA